jgi:hypothetical protein
MMPPLLAFALGALLMLKLVEVYVALEILKMLRKPLSD